MNCKENLYKAQQSGDSYCKSFNKSQNSQISSKSHKKNIQLEGKFINSPHFNVYKESMQVNDNSFTFQKFNRNFIQNKILYHKDKKSLLKINFNQTSKSKTLRIMEFTCKLSYFTFLIKVLNITSGDQINFRLDNHINEGAFGSVYEIKIKGKECALKSIMLVKSIYSVIQNAIKQIIIMKICSLLEIAPPFYDLYGFEMITTDQVVSFACEKGISIQEYLQNYCRSEQEIDQKFQKLKQKLSLMHKLSITHNDIKPDNIIYSPSLKQLVFIDFGLSQVNEQQIGFMKLQSGKGSLNYCCEQMRNLLISDNRLGYVDVYFNDLCGLIKTIDTVKQLFKSKISLGNFMGNHSILNQFNPHILTFDIDFKSISPKINCQEILNIKLNKLKRQQRLFLQEQKQLNKGHFMYFVALVYELDLKKLIQYFLNHKNMLQILYNNFQKVYFIFFQHELSFKLYNIYSKIIGSFNREKLSLNYQTEQIIQKSLQPYFRAFVQKRQFNQYEEILTKYFQNKKLTFQKLKLRYFEYNRHIKYDANYFQIKKQMISNNHLNIQIGYYNDYRSLAGKILKNLSNSFKSDQQLNFLDSINSLFNSQLKWYNLTTQKLYLLEDIFHILTVTISYQPKITCFSKIFVCVNLLAHIMLQILTNFKPNQIILAALQQADEQNDPQSKDIQQTFNKQNQRRKPIQKMRYFSKNRLNSQQDFINTYRFDLLILHKNLVALQHLCRLGFEEGSFNKQLQFNQKALQVIDKKIYEVFICEKKQLSSKSSQKVSSFEELRNFCGQTKQKCFQIRCIILKETICRIDQYSHVIGMIQFKDKFINYGYLKGLFNISNLSYLDQLIPQIQCLNLKIHKNNLMQIQVEEQIYMIIICKLMIPSSLHKKYGLVKKLQNLIEKLQKTKVNSVFSDSRITYLLSMKLTYKIEQNLVEEAIQLINNVSISRDRVILPFFYFICCDFFKRIHNSKLFHEYKHKMLELNNSNLFSKRQNKIVNIEQAVQKYRSQFHSQKQINGNYLQQYQSPSENKFYFKETTQNQHSKKQLKFKDFQTAWFKITSQGFEPQKIKFRLINLRNVIKSMIFQLKQQQVYIIKRYLKEYQIQQQKVIEHILNNLNIIKRQSDGLEEMYRYLGWEIKIQQSQQEFFQDIYRESIFSTRNKLLNNLIYIHYSGTKNIASLVQQEWMRFDRFIDKNYLQLSINVPLAYFQIKCKVFDILLSSFQEQRKHSFLHQYLKCTLVYLQKLNNNSIHRPKNISNKQQQIQLNKSIHFQQQLGFQTKVDLQIYVSFLLHLYVEKTNLSRTLFLLYTKNQLSDSNNSRKILIQNQLIQIFCQSFSNKNTGKIFTSSKSYIRLLCFLIQIGTKRIFNLVENNNIKQEEHNDSEIIENQILVQVISQIVKFVNKYPCSSYSSFLLKIFQQTKILFIKQINTRKESLSLRKNLFIINKFQSLIQNQIQINPKLSQLKVLILNTCFIKNHILNLYKSDIIDSKNVEFKIKYIGKIYRTVCKLSLFVDNLQFLMKQFAKNQIFRLMVLIQKQTKELQYLTSATLLVGKLKRMKVKYLRSCRKGDQKRSSNSDTLDLQECQSYYNCFTTLDYQIIRTIIKQTSYEPYQTQKRINQKVKNMIRNKIRRLIANVE